ncbi:MAG: HAD-IIB family hydrolase [Desulfobacterales bacterium]
MNASSEFPRVVVFTDLDASLLDHTDYSFQKALPALDLIRRRNIPLVFATSKTRAEVERLQRIMGIREPFIVENGAALFFPDDYRRLRIDSGFRQPPYTVIQLGASYAEIRRFVYSFRDQFRIRGFGDMSLAQMAELTGLAPDQARLARQREFTEPFLPEKGTDIVAFEKIAAARGFSITRGGRFYHLIGIRQDKGAAVRLAAGVFSKNAGAPVATIGIGDSTNDISMLQCVTIPVVIPRTDGTHLELDLPGLRKAARPGSAGWNEAVVELLEQLGTKGA